MHASREVWMEDEKRRGKDECGDGWLSDIK